MKQVLCLSRSYLAHLLPAVGRSSDLVFHHIVQTRAEKVVVERAGGRVVLCIQDVVREALRSGASRAWREPDDFRAVTGFPWSPIHADRYLPSFDEPLRGRIAGALQAAVEDLFARETYVGFVSEPVALFITHLLFYHCRRSGTRPLLWANTYFPGYFYFADGTTFATPVKRHATPAVSEEEIATVVQTYADGVARDTAGPVYHHSFSDAKVTKWSYFSQRRGEAALVIRPGWSARLIQSVRVARAVAKRLALRWDGDFMTAGAVAEHRFYQRCLWGRRDAYDVMPADVSPDRVVFPLQFEPEASLLYCAPHIGSQLEFADTLLRALPPGKTLWIKEHPNQFGALTLAPWRALKQRHPSLRFLHGRESGRVLMQRSGPVVSISSSMGMDALLCGRRVLVMGDVFYRGFPGAVAVRSTGDLVAALQDPTTYQRHDDWDALLSVLRAIGMQAYPGDPQPSATLFSDENLARLRAAILAEVS